MSKASLKLSAVISVHNEESQLAECLKTLEFADEIVVLNDDARWGGRVHTVRVPHPRPPGRPVAQYEAGAARFFAGLARTRSRAAS